MYFEKGKSLTAFIGGFIVYSPNWCVNSWKKKITYHEKINFNKEEQKLYDKLMELSKITNVIPNNISNRFSYQIFLHSIKEV